MSWQFISSFPVMFHADLIEVHSDLYFFYTIATSEYRVLNSI